MIDEFCKRHEERLKDIVKDDDPFGPLLAFLRFDARFADPRFVAEFLRRHKSVVNKKRKLFPTAAGMIKIRDNASHQYVMDLAK